MGRRSQMFTDSVLVSALGLPYNWSCAIFSRLEWRERWASSLGSEGFHPGKRVLCLVPARTGSPGRGPRVFSLLRVSAPREDRVRRTDEGEPGSDEARTGRSVSAARARIVGRPRRALAQWSRVACEWVGKVLRGVPFPRSPGTLWPEELRAVAKPDRAPRCCSASAIACTPVADVQNPR